MYPNLYYAFKDLFGLDVPFLRVVNSFGFFVAISFLVAAWLLVKELRRRQALGLFSYAEATIIAGKPASISDILVNFILGFILGFKLIGVLIIKDALNDPQSFIFSSNGSWPVGLLVGGFFAFLKWWEKNKQKLPKPEERRIRIWPSDRVGDITIIAAVAGFIGAKIFDNLENWDRFMEDPLGNLISPSGLTFYGGLITATLALWYYFKKKGISFIRMADAAAPVLMLAYALGRIGCQVAGDGDWGIINSAYLSSPDANIYAASPDQFNKAFAENAYLYHETGTESIYHAGMKAFAGLPDWLFAYNYPHNVNQDGVKTALCDWDKYCNHLPLPVFPTPLYEIIMGLLLFALLWSIRKKMKVAGRLFAVYLIVNGIERFLIEKIRVNSMYDIFGFHPTQAELISSLLVITGIVLYIYAPKIWSNEKARPVEAPST